MRKRVASILPTVTSRVLAVTVFTTVQGVAVRGKKPQVLVPATTGC